MLQISTEKPLTFPFLFETGDAEPPDTGDQPPPTGIKPPTATDAEPPDAEPPDAGPPEKSSDS